MHIYSCIPKYYTHVCPLNIRFAQDMELTTNDTDLTTNDTDFTTNDTDFKTNDTDLRFHNK